MIYYRIIELFLETEGQHGQHQNEIKPRICTHTEGMQDPSDAKHRHVKSDEPIPHQGQPTQPTKSRTTLKLSQMPPEEEKYH